MSNTTSFEEGVAAIADEAQQQEQTTQLTKADVATPAKREPMSDFEGELDKSDIKMPRLALAQSIGPLSDDFTPGTIVLNKKVVVAEKGEKVVLIPIRATKYFQEDLEYGTENMPRRFNTAKEAVDAGLRAEWSDEHGKPQVQPCLDVVLLIRGSNAAPEFCFEHNGERYALALWSLTSFTAYKHAATTLLTARTLYLPSFDAREWTLHTEKVKMKNGNSTFVPVLTAGQETTQEFRNWASALL